MRGHADGGAVGVSWSLTRARLTGQGAAAQKGRLTDPGAICRQVRGSARGAQGTRGFSVAPLGLCEVPKNRDSPSCSLHVGFGSGRQPQDLPVCAGGQFRAWVPSALTCPLGGPRDRSGQCASGRTSKASDSGWHDWPSCEGPEPGSPAGLAGRPSQGQGTGRSF